MRISCIEISSEELFLRIKKSNKYFEYTLSDHFIGFIVTVNLPACIKGHMLIPRYHKMIKDLFCKLKDEVIIDYFLEKVNTNDLKENKPPQPKKKKVSKKETTKNRKETKTLKHCLEEYNNIRILLL